MISTGLIIIFGGQSWGLEYQTDTYGYVHKTDEHDADA
jgi:hypothetical protein